MHDNKIHAPVTSWPKEQFFNPTPILMHLAFLNRHHKDFRVKKVAEFQILRNCL